ncbi:nuclear transport factor 2 family protein [Phenylobacterium sp. VNQ135]|uniref:nuclear transport factor 2 family protein n=1 Tax=Phenylobacterium sp. VNQ135 TaxID=3400922 RepID=UPI003C08D4C9
MPSPAADSVTRTTLTDMVIAYATALDSRDWPLMRSLLTDPVEIDYSSMGSIRETLAVEDWLRRLNTLSGFDATQHVVTNFRVEVDGERATCTSYVDALHFLTDGGRNHVAHACGVYVHEFVLTAGGWRIRKATFHLRGHQNGAQAFQEAFARAREIAGAGRS